MPVFSFAYIQRDNFRCSQEEHESLDVDRELYLCKGFKCGHLGFITSRRLFLVLHCINLCPSSKRDPYILASYYRICSPLQMSYGHTSFMPREKTAHNRRSLSSFLFYFSCGTLAGCPALPFFFFRFHLLNRRKRF